MRFLNIVVYTSLLLASTSTYAPAAISCKVTIPKQEVIGTLDVQCEGKVEQGENLFEIYKNLREEVENSDYYTGQRLLQHMTLCSKMGAACRPNGSVLLGLEYNFKFQVSHKSRTK